MYIKYIQLPHILKFSISSLSASSVCHFKDISQSLCFLNTSVGMLTVQGWETERNGVTLYSGRQRTTGARGRSVGDEQGKEGLWVYQGGLWGFQKVKLDPLKLIFMTCCRSVTHCYLKSFCTYICFIFSYSNKFY